MNEPSPYKIFGEIGTIATRQKPKKRPASYGTWSARPSEIKKNVLGHVFADKSQHCERCGMARFVIEGDNFKCEG